jgi:hypothetical protein
LAHKFGIKTFYYSLINKKGSKSDALEDLPSGTEDEEEDCVACKL